MISDCLAKYTNTTTCAHMNNAKAQTQVILVHVDVVHRPTPETCDDSVFEIADSEDVKDAQQAHTIYGTPLSPPPPINIKPDLGFPRE